jgi:hypothetical protein
MGDVVGWGPTWHADSRKLRMTQMQIMVAKYRFLNFIRVPPEARRFEIRD